MNNLSNEILDHMLMMVQIIFVFIFIVIHEVEVTNTLMVALVRTCISVTNTYTQSSCCLCNTIRCIFLDPLKTLSCSYELTLLYLDFCYDPYLLTKFCGCDNFLLLLYSHPLTFTRVS